MRWLLAAALALGCRGSHSQGQTCARYVDATRGFWRALDEKLGHVTARDLHGFAATESKMLGEIQPPPGGADAHRALVADVRLLADAAGDLVNAALPPDALEAKLETSAARKALAPARDAVAADRASLAKICPAIAP
jgi:hypothetical protein